MHVTTRVRAAIGAGVIAGVLSAFVKLGWEQLLPPRTPDRTEPPLVLLQHLGISTDELTFLYSGIEVNWASLAIHFTFSVVTIVLYAVLVEYVPAVRVGWGAVYGIAVWVVAHELLLPALGLTPAPAALPFDEQLSEGLGHIVWLIAAELIRRGVLQRPRHDDARPVAGAAQDRSFLRR